MLDTQTPSNAVATVRLLAQLTRKGARLDPDGGHYRLMYPSERRQTRLDRGDIAARQVEARLVHYAVKRQWLETDALGRLRLSEAGAVMLRRGLAIEPAVASVARPDTAAAAPNRSGVAGGAIQRLRHKRKATGSTVITSGQAEAAERLAQDFLRGQMMPRVTSNWDRAALGFAADRRGGAGPSDVGHAASAAQERVRRALADAGAEFADLLIDVCCLDIGMEAVERQRGWPQRTAHVVLGLALDRLMRHYGVVASGPQRGRAGHWGEADYRPGQSGALTSARTSPPSA